jgi:hypothetical protein
VSELPVIEMTLAISKTASGRRSALVNPGARRGERQIQRRAAAPLDLIGPEEGVVFMGVAFRELPGGAPG